MIDWFHPDAILCEAGVCYHRSDVLARTEIYAKESVITICSDSILDLVAGLLAAQRRDCPLLLTRRGSPPPGHEPVAGGFAVHLYSSGTTGSPKRVIHRLERLLGRIRTGREGSGPHWLLTYEATSFAGLQVILTALASGGWLIAEPNGAIDRLVEAACRNQVTHISGTPSFWRAFLMALAGRSLALSAVTLGGEAVDQTLLDRLAEAFPQARLRHIYASTETGAVFGVNDGQAGFPAIWLDEGVEGALLRLVDGVLEVNSPRAMVAGSGLAAEAWLSTGDLVERVGDRMMFVGRRCAVVNVGGVKVLPERIENGLLSLPGVWDAWVSARASPVTGALLVAEIVRDPDCPEQQVRAAIARYTAGLSPPERPRQIRFVTSLTAAADKKPRGADRSSSGGEALPNPLPNKPLS